MPKKKKQEAAEGSFKTSAFSALKGVRTAARPQPARPARSLPEAPEADSELFLRAASGVRRMNDVFDDDDAAVSERPRSVRELPESSIADFGTELFLEAMQSLGAGALRTAADEDVADPANKRSVSSRMRRLKKGTLRIGNELDLHGFLRDEALRRLEHFIAAAYGRGQEAVLVITGKGNNSSEGPVLRTATENWLRSRAGGMVAEFHPAPRDKGGSGAFVVFLKKR